MDELTVPALEDAWRGGGVGQGMQMVVHSSLSSIGRVTDGAAGVVESLLAVVGVNGTLMTPAFTPRVTDPFPNAATPPPTHVIQARLRVSAFTRDMPSEMGAIPEALRVHQDSVRSSHPQVSVAAIGRNARAITERHAKNFSVGKGSPFGRLHSLGGHILLVGVGHCRSTVLHYAESLASWRRIKIRRYPVDHRAGRAWEETLDVADDNSRLFPRIGQAFERRDGVKRFRVGQADCMLIPIDEFVTFAVAQFDELLDRGEMGAVHVSDLAIEE